MSTRCYIGIMEKGSDVVRSIYNHRNGSLAGVGKELLEYYSSAEKTRALVNKGDTSYLEEHYDDGSGPYIEPVKQYGSHDNTVAYYYLFDVGKNKWLFRCYNEVWKPLEDALESEEE